MSTAVAGPAAFPAGVAATMPSGVFARDAIIAWYRGEFAAANAIIDALCTHLAEISGGAPEYEPVFAAIHRRRMNWIPVLHMQRYFSISDVTGELRRLASDRSAAAAVVAEDETRTSTEQMEVEREIQTVNTSEVAVAVAVAEEEESEKYSSGDAPDRKITEEVDAGDGGSQADNTSMENVRICTNHEDCMTRPDMIKISKGFVAKEPVKGHMVNVVKGLKLYEDIFTNSELLKIAEFINELRLAGRRGELPGETFIFFNKQVKGNKREIVQLGVPLFQSTKEEAKSNIEPISPVLQTVIDHLVQWQLIPESRMPNSCIINFFDEDEYSQPYFKPPHLDNPISTLLLSETTMAFGRVLNSDHLGNYKGSLTLPVKEGSLLVMRGNSAEMARHVVCPSPNKRVSITFVKVRPTNNQIDSSPAPPLAKAMTLWQPASPLPHKVSGGGAIAYGPHGVVPSWGMTLRAPLLMLAPPRAMVMSSPGRRIARSSGTGVFLPWTVGPKKYTKHLPPRIQKRRFPALPAPVEAEA